MSEQKQKFAFSKINYYIMLAGLGVLVVGLMLMTLDSEAFGFGTTGLTLGPLTVFLAYIIQVVAIFYTPKDSNSPDNS